MTRFFDQIDTTIRDMTRVGGRNLFASVAAVALSFLFWPVWLCQEVSKLRKWYYSSGLAPDAQICASGLRG